MSTVDKNFKFDKNIKFDQNINLTKMSNLICTFSKMYLPLGAEDVNGEQE